MIQQEAVAAFRVKVWTITTPAHRQKTGKHRLTNARVRPVIHHDSFCTGRVQTIKNGKLGTNRPLDKIGDVRYLS